MALITRPELRARRDIPHEPGEWVEIRPLAGKRLEEAQRRRQLAQAEMVREMGGDVYRALMEMRAAKEEEPPAAQNGHAPRKRRDPDDYDTDTILRAGILGWSYGEFKLEHLDQLDDITRAWLKAEIVHLYEPATEEERKNA